MQRPVFHLQLITVIHDHYRIAMRDWSLWQATPLRSWRVIRLEWVNHPTDAKYFSRLPRVAAEVAASSEHALEIRMTLECLGSRGDWRRRRVARRSSSEDRAAPGSRPTLGNRKRTDRIR